MWTKFVKAVEDDIGATILLWPKQQQGNNLVHKVIILLEKSTFVETVCGHLTLHFMTIMSCCITFSYIM